MKSAALIRYALQKLDSAPATPGQRAVNAPKIAKLQADLAIATRRELKALARVLKYKADIYGPNGRIYSHEGSWEVTPGNQLVFVKVPGTAPTTYDAYNPDQLFDGHGQLITSGSSL